MASSSRTGDNTELLVKGIHPNLALRQAGLL
jgi:hypothetical protein